VIDRLARGFPEALPAVMDGAPRIGTISMLIDVELRRDPDGLSCTELARRLRRRRSDVLQVLEDEPRFTRTGRTRYARWTLARSHGTEWVPLGGVDATPGPPEPGEAQRAA
jgi:hypothetical protein